MTRKQQIEQSIPYKDLTTYKERSCFIKGVEWADTNPKPRIHDELDETWFDDYDKLKANLTIAVEALEYISHNVLSLDSRIKLEEALITYKKTNV